MSPDSSPTDGTRTGTPTRRRVLQLSGVVGTGLLSGCTEEIGDELPANEKWPTAELTPRLPVTERTEILEERIEALAKMDIADEAAFEAAFDDAALEVESVERDRDVLTMEYRDTKRDAAGTLHDVASIAGAFAALLDAGYDVVALEVTILDDTPASFGAAEVDATWAHAYNDGDHSAKEYGELVATTIETTRQPPDVGVSPRE